MKIGLLTDSNKMANMALMKISTFHKNKGDEVEWVNYFFDYDIVYISKIFKESVINTCINSKIIKIGGTGSNDISVKLPKEIDDCQLDYALYPNIDYSLFLSHTGCVRKCPFCVIFEKEGKMKSLDTITNFNPKGKWVQVLDNNFFANPKWERSVEVLFKNNQPVNLNGVDVRIITEEHCAALNSLKHKKQIHIAWDDISEKTLEKIKFMVKFVKSYKIMCYVLIGFSTTFKEDDYRVRALDDLGITPFVMPFNKKDNYQKRYATFVNKRWIYKACNRDFNQYLRQ